MTVPTQDSFERKLGSRLRGVGRLAVVGIGDELQRSDRLGMLAAREIETFRLPGLRVFLAGTVPESFTAPIRRFRPDHVILLDAAAIGAPPGEIDVLDADRIRGSGLSTHALPLGVVIEYLETSVKAPVTLIGIQPDLHATDADLTAAERTGLTELSRAVRRLLGEARRRRGRPDRHAKGARGGRKRAGDG